MTTLLCLNCDRPLDGTRKPLLFCSEPCAEEAHTVRYVRRIVADGRILDPEVAEAVKIRVGMVLGGGYAKLNAAGNSAHPFYSTVKASRAAFRAAALTQD